MSDERAGAGCRGEIQAGAAAPGEAELHRRLAMLYAPLIAPAASLLDMARAVLGHARCLTGSEHGYVSSIDPTTGDNVAHTLTDMLSGQCHMPDAAAQLVGRRRPDGTYHALWGVGLDTHTPFFTNAPAQHPGATGTPPGHVPLTRFLSVPVVLGDELVGQIALANSARDYTVRDVEAVGRLGEFYALAIQRKRAEEALAERAQQLDAVRTVSVELLRELDLTALLRLITRRAVGLVGGEAGAVVLWDDAAGALIPWAWQGFGEWMGALQFRPGDGVVGTVAERMEGLIVNDYPRFPRALPVFVQSGRLSAILAEPLVYRGRLVGVIFVGNHTPGRPFTDRDRARLGLLAPHATIAIENARLHAAVQGEAQALEARVQQRTADLEQALQVKADFLARMSHELRTPLNFILGFAGLLRDGTAGPLTPKQAHFLDRIHLGGSLLLDLVSDLLDLTLTPGGRPSLRLEPVPLAGVIRDTGELLGAQASQKGLSVTVDVEPGLSVVADRRKLSQILAALLRNALKFTPAGGRIDVTARRLFTSGAPGCVELCVRDTGIGIPPEDLEHVFHGFRQGSPGLAASARGAGLGLALVRTLVELHGGRVWAESAGPGHGACFVVHLPPLVASATSDVLLVEDAEGADAPLATALREAGYTVEVMGGDAALARLAATPPGLVVLTLESAEGKGVELLRALRAVPPTLHLPVIARIAGGHEISPELRALGPVEFLTTPVSPSVVVALARVLLAGQR